jgi:hypothetical protein
MNLSLTQLTSTQKNKKREPEFFFSPIQILELNKKMPQGFKFEKHSVLKRYLERKKEEIPLKKQKLSNVNILHLQYFYRTNY